MGCQNPCKPMIVHLLTLPGWLWPLRTRAVFACFTCCAHRMSATLSSFKGVRMNTTKLVWALKELSNGLQKSLPAWRATALICSASSRVYSLNKTLLRRLCVKGWGCKDGSHESLVLKKFSGSVFWGIEVWGKGNHILLQGWSLCHIPQEKAWRLNSEGKQTLLSLSFFQETIFSFPDGILPLPFQAPQMSFSLLGVPTLPC